MRPPTRSRWTAGSISWLTTSDHRTATTPVVLANGRAALARTLSISPLCISPWPAWRPSALATSPPRLTGRRSSPWPWWWWDVSSCFYVYYAVVTVCRELLGICCGFGPFWRVKWRRTVFEWDWRGLVSWDCTLFLSWWCSGPSNDGSGITMKFWFYWGSMWSWFVLNTQLSAQLHIF